MSGLIEKLGITPGYYKSAPKLPEGHYYTGFNNAIFVESKEMEAIKDTAPEMLEGHINIVQLVAGVRNGNLSPEMFVNMVEGISLYRCEKATNKTWEEIKELIK